MSELAERPLLGYPGATVALHVEGRSYAVVITDPVGITEWKPSTKREATDMYFHPFVYGYNYQTTASTVEEDGA